MMTLSALTIAALVLAGWMLPTVTVMPAGARSDAQTAAQTGAAQTGATTASKGERRAAAPIFRFETDEFWLNLHHFLYVLGRAEAKESDASGGAVAGAPTEAQKGLAALNDDERPKWRAAVTAYAGGLSRKDTVFDATWPALTTALARAGDAATLSNPSNQQPDVANAIDATTRATLEGVAPIYRRVWWPEHRASNQAWRTATQTLFDRHGPAIVDFLTKAYGQTWPAGGYPVRLSMYANSAGAYSTDGQLLVVATNSSAGTSGLYGLEMVFHESMHQWGMYAVIEELARVNNLPAPRALSHALIFFTAGEAVKRVEPAHVPFAEKYGLWNRGGLKALKPSIEEGWKPFLDSPALGDKTARDAAILAVLKKAPPPPPARPTPPAPASPR
jgi:hypothetical protein